MVNIKEIIGHKTKDVGTFVCDICGNKFKRSYADVKRRFKGKDFVFIYCSAKCGYDAKVTRVSVSCSNCGKAIKVQKERYKKSVNKNFFCDHHCSATYWNKFRKISKECPVCNKKIPKYNNKYCSKECKRKGLTFNKISKIEKIGFLGDNSRTTIRRYLINKFGLKCSICKIVEWQGSPVPVVVDHIDGHPENGKLDNLRLVCGNCNMLLPTFAGKNKGNGRKSRYMRL